MEDLKELLSEFEADICNQEIDLLATVEIFIEKANQIIEITEQNLIIANERENNGLN